MSKLQMAKSLVIPQLEYALYLQDAKEIWEKAEKTIECITEWVEEGRGTQEEGREVARTGKMVRPGTQASRSSNEISVRSLAKGP